MRRSQCEKKSVWEATMKRSQYERSPWHNSTYNSERQKILANVTTDRFTDADDTGKIY